MSINLWVDIMDLVGLSWLGDILMGWVGGNVNILDHGGIDLFYRCRCYVIDMNRRLIDIIL